MIHKYKFNGTFREYQQRVLDRTEDHLKDGKVHIVAAPGSGKTILGLEMIWRLNEPTLILSPTITIQHQWGTRLIKSFLYPKEMISYSIKNPKLITSITYQALHAAMKKENMKQEEFTDDDCLEDSYEDDLSFQDFDLFAAIKAAGIKTICVDEAHHLKQEWQKSLETFIHKIEKEMVIIALTATPPYDSTTNEWERYTSICGEIDEEISVPELVKQDTLCPHQDYVMFNYPTQSEKKFIKNYSGKAVLAIEEINKQGLIHKTVEKYGLLSDYSLFEEQILDNPAVFAGILTLLDKAKIVYPKGLRRLISPSGKLPPYTLDNLEISFRYIISNSKQFDEAIVSEITVILKHYGLIHHNNVQFISDANNNKILISSLGKLQSIIDIAKHELSYMKDDLRMLVLTDFIRKEQLSIVGTNSEINTMGIVPIFESLRRNLPNTTSIAAISGTLVILKSSLNKEVVELSKLHGFEFSMTKLSDCEYSEYNIRGGSRTKVSLVTQLFQQGKITVLVGTKSLLGEGWNSPVINTLILASFVGSFMLSNQMRGRAIRLDPSNPNKVSNIWHLVTLPPKSSANTIEQSVGNDYETLERRFMNFFAPNTKGTRIEVGLKRLGISRELLSLKSITEINERMFVNSSERDKVQNKWRELLGNNDYSIKIVHQAEVIPPKEREFDKGFLFRNVLSSLTIGVFFTLALYAVLFKKMNIRTDISPILTLVSITVMSLVSQFAWHFGGRKKKMKAISNAICETLCFMGIVNRWANPYIETDKEKMSLLFSLENTTDKETHEYTKAISEFFSMIENPRYVLYQIRFFGVKDTYNSFMCPSIIGTKQEYVLKLIECLKRNGYNFGFAYTRNKLGRKTLIKCRESYVTRNQYLFMEDKVVKQYKKSKDWR